MNGAQYGWGLPSAASSFARAVDVDLWVLHGGIGFMLAAWTALFVFLVARSRAGGRAPLDREGRGGGWALAAGVSIILFELVIILVYSIPTWSLIHEVPEEASANVVRVIAEQYAWNVQYPGPDGRFGRTGPAWTDSANVLGLDPDDPDGRDDVVTLNELRVPVGRPTVVHLSSKDVIHSFFIPDFRVKRDAVPGMRLPLWFQPLRAGRYELACSQLCGIGHAAMRADVVAEEPEAFEAWLRGQAGGGAR